MLALAGVTVGALAAARPSLAEEPSYVGSEVCEECHEGLTAAVGGTPHGAQADHRTPFANEGCESCHGSGEAHAFSGGEEKGPLISFRRGAAEAPESRSQACLQCHRGEELMHWDGSVHDAEDVSCSSCHRIHQSDPVLDRRDQADACYECHWATRAQTFLPSRHPIREHKTVCSDCHNTHGSPAPAQLRGLSLNQACYRCHAEVRGPFLWEHEPVAEDCSLCHRAHGSAHPTLLIRRPPHLCQMCHQDIIHQAHRHVSRMYDFDLADSGDQPGTGRIVLGMSCMNCHSLVHGSNHPSGASLMR